MADYYGSEQDIARRGDNLDRWNEMRDFIWNPKKQEVFGMDKGYMSMIFIHLKYQLFP